MKPFFSSFHSLHSQVYHPLLPLNRRPRWARMESSPAHHRDCNKSKTKLVVIMGATGTGKSRLSIDLSTTHFPHARIINSDKMQLYNGLDITTNKIPLHERKGVLHYLLGDVYNIESDVSPSQFRSAAGLTISSIASSGNLPLLVGGSNSFIHALLVETYDPRVDDVFAAPDSVSRLLRYDCCFLWVDVAWSVLSDYLCERVDDMLESGMLEELAQFYDPTKEGIRVGLRKAIGVPEFDKYFKKYPPWESEENGTVPARCDRVRRDAYEEAVREIKDNTCRLAERQVGKIKRLREAGWEMKRIDGTATFEAMMKKKEWRGIWGKEVVEPSVKAVNRFLE
ncbi:isopentenyltransferase 1, Arabidopsis thaliana isopentenyltransferase 1 [Hibiscus trionum]|uniref:adenylate dimethylallyltransferase (ADP/ATP-dependent) n=1 Tax=Hibiscus trionum TaxID=183268 RepID=A0A9W7IVE5_HIBTR|nr:isopentenyltransferase 1, Arabidopsis thaliana isopentenyltransferase 1 [Hibiscus trionum]